MSDPLNILIIEDSHADFLMVERHLKQNGLSAICCRVDTLDALNEAIGREVWDLALADYNVPQLDFEENMNLLQTALPDLPVIMVTGSVGEEHAVELLKLGVCDFVLKGNLARLVPVILRSFRDVLERKAKIAAEVELRESNERFRMIFEHSIDAILLAGTDGSVIAANPEACRVFGMSEPEILRVGRAGIVDTDDSRFFTLLEERKRTGQYRGEITLKRGDGSHFPAEISSAVFTEGDGIQKTSMIIRDVTERKKLEGQIRHSQKMEAVGQLAGGVAHDFNNILSAIFGYSQLSLGKLLEDDPVKKYVEEIMKASERAAVLTQSLLTFSRKQEVTLAVIDLSSVIKDFETFLHRLIREDIELKVSCSKETLPVMVDRGQIEQVIMNLVANGRDAMPNGGRLFIETLSVTLDQEFVEAHGYGKEGVYAVISVSDTGSGMDKETQSHIFEPFYTTKEKGKGTGLGLSMAYGIIKKHDGFINIYSEPGNGTIFKIYLPEVSDVVHADKAGPEVSIAPRGGTETILVCEDDEALRRLAVNVLSHFGYRVIEAIDGQDAIEKFVAHKESIDLVFIDTIMPKKNGRQASDEMKKVRSDIKTIFVSGYSRDIFEGDNPFDENTIFIHKPYSPNELLTMIRELLDKNNQD